MNYALIVAGGLGSRMGSSIPKQFLELERKPILFYTIKKFLYFSPDLHIIVVLPREFMHEPNIIHTYFPEHKNIQLVAGGESRFHSVQNGLNSINDEGIVFIHDGVRPFVSMEVIANCYEAAKQFGNAIPCVAVKESLRHISKENNKAVIRNEYVVIQTPQTFTISAIKKAFLQINDASLTDDASVFEQAGHTIHLVSGNEENIKITTPQDLVMAKYLLEKNA